MTVAFERLKPGVKSSFTSVPIPVARAIGAPLALLSTTLKVSPASSAVSPRTKTAMDFVSSPAAKARLPDAAV